ncbi:MAG: hypothetical protein HYV35_04825 [Lentisphaerae bacterium]|nr:hypothetical protein [Lentisphaerota bacterium]
MKYKPNWPEAKERLTALWHHRRGDRPCIAVTAPDGDKQPLPIARRDEDLWLDPGYIVQRALAAFANTYYGGEAIPSTLNMAGWVVNTYGATPRFSKETIWFDPIEVDWNQPPTFQLNWQDPYLHKVTAVHQALLQAAGKDDFLIGHGAFMPAVDMLAFIIGTPNVLLAMSDHPEWTRRAILQLTENWIALHRHFFALSRPTHDFWYGNAGWMPFWAPELYISTQADIGCMISVDMFADFVAPGLDRTGEAFNNVWYHLDGQGAFHHLPRLLALPYIKVIQFSPEAGTPANGPAHLELYRKIQAAGKIVHINVPAAHVEPLVKALDPALLMLATSCNSIAAADDLLAAAGRWTRGK